MLRKKGRPITSNRPVQAINKETGEVLMFDNYRDASDFFGANRGNVYLCLEGIRKSHMGYVFKYQKE